MGKVRLFPPNHDAFYQNIMEQSAKPIRDAIEDKTELQLLTLNFPPTG